MQQKYQELNFRLGMQHLKKSNIFQLYLKKTFPTEVKRRIWAGVEKLLDREGVLCWGGFVVGGAVGSGGGA